MSWKGCGVMAVGDAARVFDRLVRVEILLWNAVDHRLRNDHDLPLAWFEAMRIVGRDGGARVRDVAEELIITEGGASKLVDRVQAAGYAERRPHATDRRSSRIGLTDTGRAVFRRAQASLDDE